jgi:predicted MPP superfamily phosphohydrolase
MTRSLIPWIILILTVLLDIYGFTAVKHLFQDSATRPKSIAYGIYWSMTLYIVLFFLFSISFNLRENSTPATRFMLGLVLGIFISKLFLTIFLLLQDFGRLFAWTSNSLFKPEFELHTSRRAFLEKLSLGVAALPFFAFIYGMVKTAYDYQILKITVPIQDLPDGLDGMKIVQISDLHTGSFGEIEPLKKAVESINQLQADMFVFTGDLVNNRAKEYPNFIEIFREIKTPLGQYSILGNHDYGDYVEWDSDLEKTENLELLKRYHRDTNWEILCNEHRVIERNGEKFALLGVENWSAKRGFAQYGSLKNAYLGTESIPTKILLSHDPSHWDAEVRKKYKDIQLTLSGHTHGMQFGVETKYFRFSPVQWVYEQWAGLYSHASQHLYVNRGFGFIGYPGRVGIRPEITLLTLVKG